ncbi:O-antigen ligase family protein [Cobetia amphilecti]|uniref:O-antigen ligase family protein n=1 Tax=Cobetia amphilecti TaxID=1055104 RepID=UPI001CDB3407|nr:O-antigen ligase family protein [Cobetia amphilecti]UBU47592.1 O-antigen ligase family protein [Cobetia amphilecti]
MMVTNKWDEGAGWKSPGWLLLIGVASLMVYTFFNIPAGDIAKPAETLLAFSGLIAFCIWGKGFRLPVLLLLGAVVTVQLISWWAGLSHHPQWMDSSPRLALLAKLFIFISVAWWLRGSTRNTLLLWGVAATGFLLTTFFLAPPNDENWITGLSGERADFGIRNAQHSAMFFGTLLLGLVAFSKRICQQGSRQGVRITLWGMALIIALAGIVVGQTRAVWIGTIVSLGLGLSVWGGFVVMRRGVRQFLKYLSMFLAALALLMVVFGLGLGDSLEKRVNKESDVITQVLKGELTQIPYTSVGIRVNSWIAASEWIAERPLTGWGAKGKSLVMRETAWIPEKVAKKYGHLHNFFMETWVAYGLLGVLAIAALMIWIGRATWLAWRAGVMPSDMAFFGMIFFVFWMIINQFESYESMWTGLYIHNIVVGGLVTHYWRWRHEQQKQIEH